MRRKTALAEISFFAALFCASFLSVKLNFILVGFFAVLCGVALLIKNHRKILLLILIPSAVAFTVYGSFLYINYMQVMEYDGKTAEFSGEITNGSYISNDLMTVTAKGKINGRTKARVTFFLADKNIEYGDKITLMAEFSAIQNNVEFDGKDYNYTKGIFLNGNAVDGYEIKKGGFSLVKVIRNFSDYTYERILRTVGGNEGAFLGAMLCGNTSDLDNSVKTNLFRMGIGHIFSVSGTHLVIITLIFGFILELSGLSRRKRLFILEAIVIAFTIFAGMSPSVVRAAVMTTIINLSRAAKRYPDPLTTIGLCAVIMTVFTPYQVRNPSFLLSLAGAFAITCVAPLFVNYINYKGKFAKTFNTFISMCVIWVCNLPFCVMFFNEMSIVSPVMNMIFVPLCTLGLVLSVFAALTGCTGAVAIGLLKMAGLVIKPVIVVSQYIGRSAVCYIPLGYDIVKISVFTALIIVIIVSVTKKRTSAVIRSTAICTALLFAVLSVYIAVLSKKPQIYFISYKNSYVMVLNIDRKAVIIDKDAKAADACVRLLQSKGITQVSAVITFKEAENVRAAYNEKLNFCNFDSDNCYNAANVNNIDVLGFEVIFDNDELKISYDNAVIYCSEETSVSSEYDCMIDTDDGVILYDDSSFDVSSDSDIGGIAEITVKSNNMRVRRINYGIGF